MKSKLEKILKGIFLSSVGSLVANSEAQAIPYNLANLENIYDKKIEIIKGNDNSKKYILKIQDDNSYLIAGHRSHRSHSSHRSHYSHRSSSSGSSNSSTYSGSTYEKTSTSSRAYSLGDRAISLGTSGKDVRELAYLFIKIDYIKEKVLIKDILGNVTCCNNISNAIKKFQRANNLTVDGIAGSMTINNLK